MAERYPNLYQRARKEAGMTQEQAAEALSVSVETVKAWEQGQRVPRPEDAERMMAAYGTEWLGLAYTSATCGRLGAVPAVDPRELPEAVLALINRATELADDYRRLMRIAEDGVIDEREAPEFGRIAENIRDVIAASYAVLYAEAPPGKKRDRLTGGTVKRSGSRACRGQTENDCKYSIAHSRRIASPSFAGEGVSLP